MSSHPVRNFRDIQVAPEAIILLGGPVGEPLTPVNTDPDRCDYVTAEGVPVWLEWLPKGRMRGRFIDAAGAQVGPLQQHLAAAVAFAAYEGWRDPSSPAWFQDALISEVRANTRNGPQ